MSLAAQTIDPVTALTGTTAPLTETDRAFLQSAIQLGASRIGRTSPNPSVGAIIVATSPEGPIVVGRGVTGDGGRPHGEVVALGEAGAAARGATCYVSLEPCAHHGKTPPCVDALKAAGVSRVVIAHADPDPRVSGKGTAQLEADGIIVFDNVATDDAFRANLGHMSRACDSRPAVTLKLAVSKDEKIGKIGAGMVPITGDLSRRTVHAMRARADAVIVGVNTVIADDPDLTCRLPGMSDWSPARIVMDSAARTPPTAKLFDSLTIAPILILTSKDADEDRVHALEVAGAEVLRVPASSDGLDLNAVLTLLAERGVTNVLLEGGATLATAFLKADLVDRVFIFQSPDEIGEEGINALSNGRALSDSLRTNGLRKAETFQYDRDIADLYERGGTG